MKISLLVLFVLTTVSLGNNKIQKTNWVVFTPKEIGIAETTINVIIEDLDSTIWIGTVNDGLLKYDGENWTRYDTLNSPLPVNNIFSLEIDADNNLWIGTLGMQGGLAKFDGINWTVWELVQYGIEGSIVMDLEFDSEGKLWMGTYGDGLVKFDGEHFTLFNSQTTDLDSDLEQINAIKIDSEGLIWCGTDIEGAMTFDGVSEWTYYRSHVIDNSIYSIDIDHENNIWFGGVWFISKFDRDSEWIQYDYAADGSWYTDIIIDSNKTIWFASWNKGFLKLNYSNGVVWDKYTPYGFTELENEGCWAVYKDSRGNYWIGYNNGYIAVYNPDGVVGITDIKSKDKQNPYKFILSQNYPNPFNPSTTIHFSVVERSEITLSIYSITGELITTVINGAEFESGNYEVTFNASSVSRRISSGTYIYSISNGMNTITKKMTLLK